MNLDELIKKNRRNGGHFFDWDTLKSRQEKLADFTILKQNPLHLVLQRTDGAKWVFDVKTGRVIHNLTPENVVEVGDTVDVTHKADDLFNHDFQGHVVSIGTKYIRVKDQEDDAWDCDADQVTISVPDTEAVA